MGKIPIETAESVISSGSPAADELLERLRETEQRLRHVVRNAPVIFWVFDRNGIFTFLDGRGLDALGEKADARVGRSVFEVYRDQPDVLRSSLRVLAGEEFSDIQYVRGLVFETHFVPLHDGDGEVIGGMGISTDITERRQAEESLRRSEAKFRGVFEGSPTAISVQRFGDGRFIDVNEEFLRLTGHRRDAVIGRTPDELHLWATPFDRRSVARALRRDGSVRDRATDVRTRDGGVRSVLVSAALLEIGSETCVLGFFHDVTVRRQAENALRQVSGRLLQSQDEERRRIARELHDSTAQELAAVKLALALVEREEGSLSVAARRALADAAAQIDGCARDIRTLSYLLHPPMLDEAGLPAALGAYVEGFARRSGIEVALDVSPDLGRMSRDLEVTLFRIVQESLTNIHRHSGSATAGIRLRRDAASVMLEVRDAGRGLDHPVSPRVSAASQALGVGIPGMYERVRQLGGRIEIASGDPGTVVRATLPAS